MIRHSSLGSEVEQGYNVTIAEGTLMLNSLKADVEPAWAARLWYGSVFGLWCALGATVVALSFMKHGTFRFFVGPWYFALSAFALHSFVVAMKPNPSTKKLSFRIGLLTVLGVLPWIVRAFAT
jgi:hypothetical protein